VRISKGLGKATELDVYFDDDDPDAVLHITYRPTSFTVAQLDEIRLNAEKNPRRLIESVLNVVVSWDLEDDEDEPIALDIEAIYGVVPTSILSGILKAINEDQTPSGKAN
jgi:hypothetical protein